MHLRDVQTSDLPVFFEQQLDIDANHMAAFTVRDPGDKNAFMARWQTSLTSKTIDVRTILYNGQVAGHVLSYIEEDSGRSEVSYWLGRAFWGKGIASTALAAFLKQSGTRPLYARVAKDNLASLRVLEKCGFTRIGEDKGFANARGQEIEEFLLRLDANEKATI